MEQSFFEIIVTEDHIFRRDLSKKWLSEIIKEDHKGTGKSLHIKHKTRHAFDGESNVTHYVST